MLNSNPKPGEMNETAIKDYRDRNERISELTASRVKLIRGLLGSTKANDRIRRRLRQPNSFS
jgi:hypothetical protein